MPKATKKDLAKDVDAYRKLQAQIKFFSEQLASVRERLQDAAVTAPEGRIVTPEFAIVLSECKRENFSLAAAKKALGEKALAPFVSTTTYTQLRVS